jgi:hypothetical protein
MIGEAQRRSRCGGAVSEGAGNVCPRWLAAVIPAVPPEQTMAGGTAVVGTAAQPGKRFGAYELVEKIGEGGMGPVSIIGWFHSGDGENEVNVSTPSLEETTISRNPAFVFANLTRHYFELRP